MSSLRQPLRENPAARHIPATKKAKASMPTTVLTFALSHSPVQVQCLSTNTIYELVDIICNSTTVGMDESVYDHMWDVEVPGFTGSFNSSDEYVNMGEDYGEGPLRKATSAKLGDLRLEDQTTLRLKYDYGSTTYYDITLIRQDEESNVSAADFPREKPVQAPTGYAEFQTDQINLNEEFPVMNKFLTESEMLVVDLFQPGRKKNHGYMERGNVGVKHMIFLPTKPGKDLSDYLHTLDYACQFKYRGHQDMPMYNWFSMVVFPSEYDKSYGSYGKNLEPGFCDLKKASANTKGALNAVFPKVSALAGYKKDKNVPKGWISYRNKMLLICSGSAKETKCNAPPGTAFHGEDQHNPASPDSVLFQMKVEIRSLHHLLCVSEGLLRTL